ncbi:hypothetical protein M422DRAFT_238981 [Sphaerobolus stellatus SS14]|nr:hypothetical protein M422DRAFT_238981 [Sphaerobolus stellatus SS14]
MLDMTQEELVPYLIEVTRETIAEAGGSDAWDQLSKVEKEIRHNKAFAALHQHFGKEAFEKLSDSEKWAAIWFVRTGCCMHKELNTVKGGYAEMNEHWEKNGIPGPIKLLNQDNAAAAEIGNEKAKEHANNVSQGGSIKLTSLAGAALQHKDKKKGHQDAYSFHMEEELNFPVKFPDTSNTRYQSHCEDSSEIIFHLDLIIKFLHLVKDLKESRILNHLEANLLKGLQDLPTIEELCVLSLLSMVISHPYMHQVRGPEYEKPNVLDLGPFHLQIWTFMEKIIENPDVVLGSGATYEQHPLMVNCGITQRFSTRSRT